jgi:Protein of unknown function (DUF2934)
MPALLERPSVEEDTPPSVPEPIPHEEIKVRAYFRYINRGSLDGFAVEDWLEAERELREEAETRDIATTA